MPRPASSHLSQALIGHTVQSGRSRPVTEFERNYIHTVFHHNTPGCPQTVFVFRVGASLIDKMEL